MRATPKERHDAGAELWNIAQIYKEQYRSDLSDEQAFKLAMLANPELGRLYIGHPVRDGLAEVKKFLLRQ